MDRRKRSIKLEDIERSSRKQIPIEEADKDQYNNENSNTADEEAYDAYEEGNDEKEEEEGNAEEEEEANEDQGLRKKPFQHNKQGGPALAGIITKVYMENFMCHRKFKVDFCSNVNFIQGQNGSGKSAILAAIQICLGAGARRTHRARNLKDLVRHKATGDSSTSASAKIRVTVLNGGADAYKHDVYGDKITVECSIALQGGYRGYKILDVNGIEKSRSKKDLHEMLDHLNIQVENPVAILDQEDAKKFLIGKPQDKYNFFLKVTELERLDNLYASTCDQIVDLDQNKNKLCNIFRQVEDNVTKLKKECEDHEALQKLEVKVMELYVNYSWAFYTTMHEESKEHMEQMQKFLDKRSKKQQELTQAESEANTPENEEQTKRDKLESLVDEANEQAEMKRELEAELKRVKAPTKTMERQLHQLKRDQKTANTNLKRAKKYLQEARDKIMEQEGSAESEQTRQTAELQKAEADLEEAKHKTLELKQAVALALRSYEELEPKLDQARHNVITLTNQMNGVQRKLQGLQLASNNSVAIFGQRCAKVCQELERATKHRKFRGPVVGPIGSYLKIAEGKENFAKLAEHALGNSLDRFILTNDHDRAIFQKIRQKVGCRQDCGIFQVHNSPRYNVPPPPVEGVETVASVLNIENDLVFNCLVDQGQIERKALTPSREFGEQRLLVSGSNGRITIRGGTINEVYFLPNCDKWVVNKGVLSMIGNERKTMRQSIGVDRSAAIEEAQKEIAILQEELTRLQAEENKADAEHTKYQREWNQQKRAQQKNGHLIQKINTKIVEIKTEMETTANFEIDTTELEEDVTNAEQDVDALKERENQLEEDISKREPEIYDIQTRLEEVILRNEKVLDDIKSAEDDLTYYSQKLNQRQEKLEIKRKKLAQLEEIISMHQAKANEYEEQVNKSLQSARILTHRYMIHQQRSENEGVSLSQEHHTQTEPTEEELEAIEPRLIRRQPSYFSTRVKRAEEEVIKEREKRRLTTEDPAVTYEKYARAKADLDGKRRQIDEISSAVKKLTKDRREREKKWLQFRQFLSNMTHMKFGEMLQLNNSTGEVEFNHKERALNLIVQKDKNNETSQTKDVKALSGGERSFATMCLLLALGEALETPFRILDEFDVFLDPQVRKLTIEALIHVAKKSKDRQFIFITPQDLSSVTPDNTLKILKLKQPERSNLAGRLSQQTLNYTH